MLYHGLSAIERSVRRKLAENPKRRHLKVKRGLGLAGLLVPGANKQYWIRHTLIDDFVLGPFSTREAAETAADAAFEAIKSYMEG
jgi:hypothetical protein